MNKTCKNKCSHYFNLKGDRNTHLQKGCSILLSIIWKEITSKRNNSRFLIKFYQKDY